MLPLRQASAQTCVEAPDIAQNERAFKLFQRLNIRTFSTILELVRAEYKDRYQDNADKVHTINPVTRRLLPGLRFYSFWLISRAALLSAHLGDSMMIPFLKEFWTVYLQTLTLIMSTTRFEELPRPEYLLEEDDEIIGFTPLQEGQLQQRFLNLDGTSRKPKCHGHGIKRHHPNIEMLCRFRDFVEDAIDLAHNEVEIFPF